MKYLVTEINGYDLEVNTFFLNADSINDVVKYMHKHMNEEYTIGINKDKGTVYGQIECDEHHMISDSWAYAEPVENVKEYTVKKRSTAIEKSRISGAFYEWLEQATPQELAGYYLHIYGDDALTHWEENRDENEESDEVGDILKAALDDIE